VISGVLISWDGYSSDSQDRPAFELTGIHAQTPDFLTSLTDLLTARGSPTRLNSALQDRYGQPQESFSLLRARARAGAVFLHASGEFVGWGLAEDPVISRLHGKAAVAAEAGLGISTNFFGGNSRTSLAGIVGTGLAKKSDGVSSDFVENIPAQTEELRIYGVDFEHTQETYPAMNGGRFGCSASLRESVFLSSAGSRFQAHRWKLLFYAGNTRSGLADDASIGQLPPTGVGLHAVFGPQSIPQDILPRIWDYTHQTAFLPYWAALWGAGADLKLPATPSSTLRGTFGYYGGHWGGALSIQKKKAHASMEPGTTITISSWGLSGSTMPDYLSEQIWTGSVSWAF
jgi:hypothetical protein